MPKIVCFGELLLRMSPSLDREWIRHASIPVYVGGAELNAARALARWELPVKYISAIPDHYLSKEIIDELQHEKIDTSSINFSGDRIGIYYLPQGADLKNTGVIYDRANSSFAQLRPGMIDWKNALNDADWFHFSAICPALNENVVAVCKEGLEAASKMGLTISIDLNYRSKLWKYGKKPTEVMPDLVKHANLIMGNIWAANDLLGIPVDSNIHDKKSKEAYLEHAGRTSLKIMEQYPSCKIVANTFRFNSNDGLTYYAALNNGRRQDVSKEFQTQKVIDQVGSGDCFMAGLIYGIKHEFDPQAIINYAAAAAFGKLFEKGDTTTRSAESILDLLDENYLTQIETSR